MQYSNNKVNNTKRTVTLGPYVFNITPVQYKNNLVDNTKCTLYSRVTLGPYVFNITPVQYNFYYVKNTKCTVALGTDVFNNTPTQ